MSSCPCPFLLSLVKLSLSITFLNSIFKKYACTPLGTEVLFTEVHCNHLTYYRGIDPFRTDRTAYFRFLLNYYSISDSGMHSLCFQRLAARYLASPPIQFKYSARQRSWIIALDHPLTTSKLTNHRLLSTAKTKGTSYGGARRSPQREAYIRERNKSFASWAIALTIATVGLSYASVPLYRVFCQVTGFGGTVKRTEINEEETDAMPINESDVVEGRPITIRFNADLSARVPWRFTPLQSEVVVLPGETALAFYVARNLSDDPITGIATYNVTPAKAAIYFNKVQCFCFDEQRLKPGEALDMPVFFYIDPEFAHDEEMADVKDIVLSYTFFKAEDVTPEQLQRAQALAMGH